MSVTVSEARTRVRLRLEDGGASTVWSDEEIDAGLRQALDTYSHWFPDERSIEVQVQQGERSIDLPDDALRIQRVIDPRGSVIPPRGMPLRGTSAEEQGWEVWSDRIAFSCPLPAGDYEVWYTAPREFPSEDGEPLPVPANDVSLLVTGAVVWCLEQRSVAEWKRGPLPARYETVLRRAREEHDAAWRTKGRQVRTGRVVGTG